jgi:sulfate permease, SulP family
VLPFAILDPQSSILNPLSSIFYPNNPMFDRCFGRMAGYNAHRLRKDVTAGVVVGIVALPLAMAFAIASGVPPERGLYTAIVAGVAVSVFGGSRVQIGGPTGAMVAILSLILLQYGLDNLLLAGFVAGLMLIVMGIFRVGALIRFIPYPVTTGFTAGIAVIIFTGQLNQFLGLTGIARHERFHLNLLETFRNLARVDLQAAATAATALACILITPKLTRKIPGSFIGMLAATALASLLQWPVETVGSHFGGIPRTLPWPSFPPLTFSSFLNVLQPAFTIAVLCAIESLLSCVVADSKTGEQHDPNKELVGQGIANCLAPLFGGIPATGAIARTATSIRSGGNSPVAGVVHALTLVLIMLLFAPWASHIPLASLAPILMVVAWHMSEIHQVRHILKGAHSDVAVLAITFLLTVFADLTVAVQFGLLMAAILFIKRMSDVHRVDKVLPDVTDPKSKVRAVGNQPKDCPQATILSVEGALFFGAARQFEREVTEHITSIRTLILRIGRVPVIDATGEKALRAIQEECEKKDVLLLLSGLQPQPREVLESTGLLAHIGPDRLFTRTGPALNLAITRMDAKTCSYCPHFVFRECEDLKYRGVQEFGQQRQDREAKP